MIESRLVVPSPVWEAAFRAMAQEEIAAGEPPEAGNDRYPAALSDFPAYLDRLNRDAYGIDIPADFVPRTTYWLAAGEVLLGVIRLRHRLTPALLQVGGHIGYRIRPSARRQGNATRLLALTLTQARAFGLNRVLLTCLSANVASARVIEKNGGILDNFGTDDAGRQISRYWITL